MLCVIGKLFGPAPLRFIYCTLHGIGDGIRIHYHMTLCISCSTSDCLNQGCFRSQEAFFICIQNCHKRNFRYVETFSEKIDAYKYIENTLPQVSYYLHSLQSIHL